MTEKVLKKIKGPNIVFRLSEIEIEGEKIKTNIVDIQADSWNFTCI